jgi:hypothetical protein
MYRLSNILLMKCRYVQRRRGHHFDGDLTGSGNDHGVLADLRANKVLGTVAASVAVGGNDALTPEAETVDIC